MRQNVLSSQADLGHDVVSLGSEATVPRIHGVSLQCRTFQNSL